MHSPSPPTSLYAGGNFTSAGGDPLARSAASFSLAAAPPGGPSPPTATSTGTVLVNGSAFTAGTIPYGATVDVTNGTVSLKTETGTLQAYGAGVSASFVLSRGTDNKKPIVELRLTGGAFGGCAKRSDERRVRRIAPDEDDPPVVGEGQGAIPDDRTVRSGDRSRDRLAYARTAATERSSRSSRVSCRSPTA